MAYKSERKNRKAASGPKERSDPFDGAPLFGRMDAKNDPVGTEEYKANPYALDKKLNWVDRS